jgi:hypothetical protein
MLLIGVQSYFAKDCRCPILSYPTASVMPSDTLGFGEKVSENLVEGNPRECVDIRM